MTHGISIKNRTFIADLHLSEKDREKTKDFERFLNNECANIDTLYILGDFFDIWMRDDSSNLFLKQIKSILKNYTSNKKHKIFIVPGNRDFLLNNNFGYETGVNILKDPTLISIDNEKILLTHGHRFCTSTILNKLYITIVNSSLFKFLFLKLPLSIRKKLASKTRKISISYNKKQPRVRQLNTKEIIKLSNKFNTKKIIHGHTHIVSKYKIKNITIFSVYQ